MKTYGRLFATWLVAGLFLGTSATAQQGGRAKTLGPGAARPAARPKAPARPVPNVRPTPKARPKVERPPRNARPTPKARPKPKPNLKPAGPRQPAPSPFVGGEPTTVESQILELTNVERAKAGLAPLTWNNRLGAAAQGHTANMAQTGVLDHEIDGNTLGDRIRAVDYRGNSWAENLYSYFTAGDIGPLADQTVAGWMNSPSHRANILDPDFTELGVGVVLVVIPPADGSEADAPAWRGFYATQVFGRPSR